MSNPTEQLKLLREFVGTTIYTETSLTDCLRQNGYNVERAAEALLTGQYRPSNNNRDDRKPAARRSNLGGGGSTSRAASSGATQIARATTTISYPAPSRKQSTTTTTSYKSITATTVNTAKRVSLEGFLPEEDDGASYEHAWLLAERWISECLCNCRRGSIRHKEVLALSHSKTGPPSLRFKGERAEGTLPTSLAAFMVPLLRYSEDQAKPPLLLLHAESLFEEKDLSTGSTIPIRLRMYLPNPKLFFELFMQDENGAEGTSVKARTSAFFDANSRSKTKRSPLLDAAFALLQYGEYGDVPKFEVPAVESIVTGDGDEVISEELFDEEDNHDEDADEEAKELDNSFNVTGAAAKQLPEAEDPPGFVPGMTLRSYQRQALYWMRLREKEGNSRSEHDEQLSLLKELANYEPSNDHNARPYSPGKENRGHIFCDCGPVVVSAQAQSRSLTIDGQINPVSHPLWKQRYLASACMKKTITFYVNEVFAAATHMPPEPPKACSGGILADSMGLGKTVIVLAVILQEKAERMAQTDMVMLDAPTTTLVIVKLSLINQWEQEIKTKTNLSVYVYHDCAGAGTIRKSQPSDFAGVDIVLTTYNVLPGEVKRKQPTLLQYPWLRIVLDEAHSIKNHQSQASKAACSMNAIHRWACTGTIVQNGLDDVFGLMKFLGHEPWCWNSFWKAAVTKPWSAGHDEKDDNLRQLVHKENVALVLSRVRKLLDPLMIRRTKEMVQLDLPPVDTQVIRIEFSEAERAFYDAVLERSNEIFDAFVDKGTVEKSYLQILSMISRLRQTCNHMYLTVRSKLDEDALVEIEGGSVTKLSRKRLEPKKDDALGRSFFEDLLRKVQAVASPRKKPSDESPEGPCKRAKDNAYLSEMVKGLSTAVQDNSVYVQDECPICLETPLIEKAVISPCGHIFCKSCLVQYLRDKAPASGDTDPRKALFATLPDGECPCCNKIIKARKVVELTKSKTSDGAGESFSSKYLTDVVTPNRIKREVRETQEGNSSALARRMLEEAVSGVDKDSSKLTAVLDELYNVWQLEPGSKTLVFSHYLGFLDMLSAKLQSEGIPCYRFDGSLTANERTDVLNGFTACQPKRAMQRNVDKPAGAVLLMSMTAGAEGLNLTTASSCFIVEPWWHSAKEEQCVNRIHRIGQEASIVRVRKFIVNDSVEEQILKMQQCKKGVADELYNDTGDGDMSGSRLSLDDFKLIFQRNK
ncbi:hypothetical protein MPSEU_000662800 [Mayamaea pseudoterrestris]|nr:hypothetical protein MPSEU_000662800 [Mayamaea pseudoterrestris]